MRSASPERWLYDADMKVSDFEWTLANKFYRIPGALTANIDATADNVAASVAANMTSLDFSSSSGLKRLVDGFTAAADSAMRRAAEMSASVQP